MLIRVDAGSRPGSLAAFACDSGLSWEKESDLRSTCEQPLPDAWRANAGFRCMLVVHRETGQGAAVMANGDGGDRAVGELLQALAKEYGWPR